MEPTPTMGASQVTVIKGLLCTGMDRKRTNEDRGGAVTFVVVPKQIEIN